MIDCTQELKFDGAYPIALTGLTPFPTKSISHSVDVTARAWSDNLQIVMTHNEKRQHWLKEGAIGLGTGVLYGITSVAVGASDENGLDAAPLWL